MGYTTDQIYQVAEEIIAQSGFYEIEVVVLDSNAFSIYYEEGGRIVISPYWASDVSKGEFMRSILHEIGHHNCQLRYGWISELDNFLRIVLFNLNKKGILSYTICRKLYHHLPEELMADAYVKSKLRSL